ncbi:hypothetical protein FACS1894174_00670 [Bacteroidia bacterium]|nr:hypothetical protein FACS1894203_4150 [Bacteroidia bacterium]GHV19886.1 hypothetical protein FACS1894174_00670 [Bacteroidia bacterium]
MKKLMSIILITFIFYGCYREKQTTIINRDYVTIQAQNIDFNADNQVLLSDFVDKIDIIPLEFTDSCILKEIGKIVIHDGNIFIIEARRPEIVFRFDMQGNFLNRIGVRGQGPEELVELRDFSINEESHIVYLLDNMRQTVLCYTFDGHFIESIKINQYASELEYKNGLFYLYFDQPVIGEHLYSLIIRNIKGEIENMFFPSRKYPINMGSRIFTKTNGEILFHKPMNDTIYSLDGTTLKYTYYFDFGSLRYMPEEIKEIYMEQTTSLQVLLNNERISGIDYLYQIGKWIYFNSIYKVMRYSFLYDMNNRKLKVSAHLWDDLEYMFYNNTFYGQTQDALIGVYETNNLLNDIDRYARYEKEKYISNAQKEEQVKKMAKIMRGNNPEEMNPWVLLYYLKK